MESRFPAMSVLWLGREFYRGKYEMTDSSQVSTLDFRDKLGYFGDEIWDLKGAGIFSISLLGEKIRHECARSFHVTVCRRNYKKRALGCVVDRLASPWSANVFGVLSAVRARKLVS
ncbi:hypothetical protein AVEN_275776-1 [Araneus ventricosus]|uniref:Uncharacterized protein n=1 Tax=Araneus ventricosus TaxID=182803 RepID=A0A4Y2HEQ2_ARAVE|nr:hypothetical protein AVEN_275776-1 [Araneus ventricosus]